MNNWHPIFGKRAIKRLSSLLVVGCMLVAGKASAYVMKYSALSSGYSNCSYKSNGNGTSTVQLSIGFKEASGHTGGAVFSSRGIIIYTYNASGSLNSSASVATDVQLDGVGSEGGYVGGDYVIYRNSSSAKWKNIYAFVANVSISFKDTSIVQWPAIGVRAGNFTQSDDVGDSAGLAYIAPSTKDGVCELLANPGLPPPPVDVTLTMTAPDWDLGELTRAEETVKTLSTPKDQLCFSYEGAKFVTFQKYIINATNINGLSDNGRYLLKSLEDSSQTVPYSLTLQSPTDSILLPNTNNTVLTLSDSGRTCFTPTFKTLAAKWVKGGAYSDVLTFTVVAKP